jgi:hypothetical protein
MASSRDANTNMCLNAGIVDAGTGGGNRLYGVVDGVFVASADRVDELSNRMFARNVPSQDLQPNFDMRPVATKYAVMPIYDQYKPTTEAMRSYPAYSPHNVYNPGTSRPHFNGFASKVNVESTLRNQWFALQNAEQSVYVPSSTSDLYNTAIDYRPVMMPHPHLAEDYSASLEPHNCNPMNLGRRVFENSTRMQLKDVSS